jgi:pimeloyl-ACP methyl ester carboxylesterase
MKQRGAMALSETSLSNPAVRRGFADIADGQVHYRVADAGATGRTPLVLLHQSPMSSLTYQELLPRVGARRRSVALDTPGFGESFRPRRLPAIADYARWLHEAARGLGLERFDLLGMFTGASIAAEMATAFPQSVRRVVLCGPPLFTPEQQAQFLTNAWPAPPVEDGSHLLKEWSRVMTRALPGVPFARRCDAFHEYYRGGADAIWGEMAVSVYPLAETLPRLTQPTLVLEPDGIYGDCARAAALVPDGRLVRLGGVHGWSMMQTAPDRVAAAVDDFLDS